MNPFFKLPTRIFIMLSLLLGAICLSACGNSEYRIDYNYRIKVDVEVDGKIYSGSSVHSGTFFDCPSKYSTICVPQSGREKGEAVVVDVGGRGYLFLLYNLSVVGLTADGKGYHSVNAAKRLAGLTGESSWKINDEYVSRYPFVTFTDINDPKSVKAISPIDYSYKQMAEDEFGGYKVDSKGITVLETKKIKSNFQEYFGKNAKLLSVTIFPTKDPVTYGQVEKTIPWIIDGIKNKNLFASDGPNYDIGTYYSNLSTVDFIIGNKK